MRAPIVIIACFVAGCGSKEDAREEARKEAEALEAKQAEATKPAKKITPPVPGEARIPCEQLLDPAAFTAALGEAEPLTIKDVTATDAEAAASCSLVRGGAKLTQKEQEALAKKTNRRMGVLPGDDLCNVTAYCWTIETPEGFMGRCKQRSMHQESQAMGTPSCVQLVQQGADDVYVHKFFDEDTKCVLQVRGGPSLVDNDKILECAKTARDTIGPAQIAVSAPPVAP